MYMSYVNKTVQNLRASNYNMRPNNPLNDQFFTFKKPTFTALPNRINPTQPSQSQNRASR